MRHVVVSLLVTTTLGACEPEAPAPPAAEGVRVVNIIPASLSGETNQDSEPFLAVHAANPLLMAASAFTPDPVGDDSETAPIFVTQDGGARWSLRSTLPSVSQTSDITFAFGGADGLYSGILRRPGRLLLNALLTTDVLSSTVMTVQGSRPEVDQPFVRAVAIGDGGDRVYVGLNDFSADDGRTATVDVSLDGGATFRSIRIEPRDTSGQNGPSVRPTIARDGTVYVAYFGWRTFDGLAASSDVVVVRDDSGGQGASPFRDLMGTDGLPGRVVAAGRTIPWSNAPTLGQERIGSTLSIAVDPNASDVVYVAWADRVGDGDVYTVHVRGSTDRGVTWSDDVRTLRNATCVALAVADNGTVGLLYQQVTGSGSNERWITRLEQTRDAFASVQEAVLATVPARMPVATFLPYLGDYNYLSAVGGEFRGVFSTSNVPDPGHFPQGVTFQRRHDFGSRRLLDESGDTVSASIDPFYFSVPVAQ